MTKHCRKQETVPEPTCTEKALLNTCYVFIGQPAFNIGRIVESMYFPLTKGDYCNGNNFLYVPNTEIDGKCLSASRNNEYEFTNNDNLRRSPLFNNSRVEKAWNDYLFFQPNFNSKVKTSTKVVFVYGTQADFELVKSLMKTFSSFEQSVHFIEEVNLGINGTALNYEHYDHMLKNTNITSVTMHTMENLDENCKLLLSSTNVTCEHYDDVVAKVIFFFLGADFSKIIHNSKDKFLNATVFTDKLFSNKENSRKVCGSMLIYSGKCEPCNFDERLTGMYTFSSKIPLIKDPMPQNCVNYNVFIVSLEKFHETIEKLGEVSSLLNSNKEKNETKEASDAETKEASDAETEQDCETKEASDSESQEPSECETKEVWHSETEECSAMDDFRLG
jgi:hypothetical protein